MALAACALAGCGSSTVAPGTEPPTGPPPGPAAFDLHLAVVGDILLDRGVGESITVNGVESILPIVADQLRAADITFGNLECPLATVGPRDPWDSYIFRADPANVAVLSHGGLDMVSVANNHTLNSGHEALVETLDHLESAGIGYVGAAREQERGSDPTFLSSGGLRVGFLAYTDLDFPHDSYSRVDQGLTRLAAQIGAARAQSDLLVVSFHWGTMDSYLPTGRQTEVAHASIDAGADVVIGHHPHVLQGMEVYRGRPILYSVANFVFDARWSGQAESGIFDLFYRQGVGWEVWVTPVWIPTQRMGPEYATGWRRRLILTRLTGLSARLGTQVEVVEGWARLGYSSGGAGTRLWSPASLD